jgi:hypothetical protein
MILVLYETKGRKVTAILKKIFLSFAAELQCFPGVFPAKFGI